ncbi:MAG: 4Fe-4S dicluster domain-containing protein [Treponema sp.]|jgi:2-oxoglutarate ferredoxin oxidoreductase subunit delta|nr:MAG: 2-oxoglutarate-acceptor oxidoreductase subunit OorD [Spirochaetes bacterium ADurb.Bin269]TAH54286.1 MAG: 4Fe-4S dicluster domain-containing protein [Treponema sp.]HPX47404.1 4Fe-4S binding protein [Treponemataceae bacterium]HQL32564.1 4Fe-4S binding protein [Treponemataceae bacterium]
MKKGMVEIDTERCKGCFLCVRACPFGVLAEDEKTNASGSSVVRIDRGDACTACASCYQVCPDSAITVFRCEGAQV